MKYWKIRFDGKYAGSTGWLPFDDEMNAQTIVDENGNTIPEPRDYTPIEFDTTPSFAN